MNTVAYNVKCYLSAVGAAAIYVSIFDQIPRSVGAARDLDRVLPGLRTLMGIPVEFGWVAWGPSYNALVAIAQTPDVMVRQRADGVKVSKNLNEVVQCVLDRAACSEIVLTPHRTVVQRANALAGYVEQIFAEMRARGQMAAFNAAYKSYRRSAQSRGETVLPYWKAEERLRRVTIRALASNAKPSIAYGALAELFAQEFPWFNANALDSYRERA